MFVNNVTKSIAVSLTVLRVFGFWIPEQLSRHIRISYYCYGLFWFTLILGITLISQVVEIYFVWGNLPLMTAVSFIFFTNLVQTIKINNIVYRKSTIQALIDDFDGTLRMVDSEEARAIVKRCDKETTMFLVIYYCVSIVTLIGWASGTVKGSLPVRAWFPFDVSQSPAYEICCAYQMLVLLICSFMNMSKDSLVTGLMAQCRCRLQLLGLSLRTLCQGITITEHLLTSEEEAVVNDRLRFCVNQHCDTLEAAKKLQDCFSFPTFMQFNVSLLIICVTAFQLVAVRSNPVRLLTMGGYLFDMMLQVFLYCYQGSQLSEESIAIADAAYDCPWYVLPTPLRRALIIIMARTSRAAKFTAAGFTTLSLSCFMAIIKTSYSMFTLLQQMEIEN